MAADVRADGVEHRVAIGTSFGKALCEHFGLPPEQVTSDMQVHVKSDEVFGVTLRIALTPSDMAGIARYMGAKDGAVTTDPDR